MWGNRAAAFSFTMVPPAPGGGGNCGGGGCCADVRAGPVEEELGQCGLPTRLGLSRSMARTAEAAAFIVRELNTITRGPYARNLITLPTPLLHLLTTRTHEGGRRPTGEHVPARPRKPHDHRTVTSRVPGRIRSSSHLFATYLPLL